MELQEFINVASFQFQMNKIGGAICEFEMDFKKSSCWLSNVSNDDVISVFVKVLKTGVEKDIFCLSPTKNSQEYPPGMLCPHRHVPRTELHSLNPVSLRA